MECPTCEKRKDKFYCTKCVKEGLRSSNYQLQSVLRKKEEAQLKVKDYLSTGLDNIHAEKVEKTISMRAMRAEMQRLHSVIEAGSSSQVPELKLMVERQKVENLKTDVATRKSDLAAAGKRIKAGHESTLKSLRAEILRTKEKRENVHQNLALARRARCMDAAELLRFRPIAGLEDTFAIAGVPVVDLHLLAKSTPLHANIQLSYTSHLLSILAKYLGLKLPNEIIPSSRDGGHPCIRRTSTATRKTTKLQLSVEYDPEKPELKLKDLQGLDPFIEALALLAWDVAWVLWTQNLWHPSKSQEKSLESLEACRLAKNLYRLSSSNKIGRISHSSTLGFIPTLEANEELSPFTLEVGDVRSLISKFFNEGKIEADIDDGQWDMLGDVEELTKTEGWIKLNMNTVGRSER